MNYECQILSSTKAVIEIIPEAENVKALFSNMDKNNPDDYTLRYHYSKGLERAKKSAVLLEIDSFESFPTQTIISYDLANGIGGF